MVAKKHDWRLVYENEETGEIREFIFKNIGNHKFQMFLGKLVNNRFIPKGILWPGGPGKLYKDGKEVGFDEAKIAVIKKYAEAGYSCEEIAQQLNRSKESVQATLDYIGA